MNINVYVAQTRVFLPTLKTASVCHNFVLFITDMFEFEFRKLNQKY